MKDTNIYKWAATTSATDVISEFQATSAGLDEETVSKSLREYGSNAISHKKKESIFSRLFKSFITPFTLVLFSLAVISFVMDYLIAPPEDKSIFGAVIIVVMVTVSGIVTFIQSVRSGQAADKLTSMVKVTATVTRKETGKTEILIEDVVCGDIVYLSAGDMIPADMRLIRSKDLFISQATMTGESQPIEKTSAVEIDSNKNTTDLQNIVFMGSNVVSGSAIGIVIVTGDRTQFGKIAKSVSQKKAETGFEKGLHSVSWLLIRFMAVMVPFVFFINGFTKGDWLEAFMFGLSVAVGLTPEMLPMIVTTNLVKGTTDMAKRGTIIKNISSIQNFGAIDVLCTDKTGTLTQDKIILEYHLDVLGNDDLRVLRHAFLNSYFQTGLKNLMDIAIIESAKINLVDQMYSFNTFEKVDEIPFDFTRRRMSVVVKSPSGKTQMITKGAIEEMLKISTFVEYEGEVKELTNNLKTNVLKTVDKLNENGFRVIAISQKNNPSSVGEFSVSDEKDMVLIGYLAFLDPPKETSKPAINALKNHGVTVKILTGDNELVTQAVCKQVGLDVKNIISGKDIENAAEEELKTIVEENNVFVKLSPMQKSRVVKRLRDSGHVVGFMGDGINDAPAMKEADVGISVDTAVDISKESADVILLGKDLMILEKGISVGRKTYGNIIKYIKMTASSNFGNMFSILIASIFLPFLPMMPIQILFLNLIYDLSCISMPWDNIDKEFLDKPRRWDASAIGRFMKWFGPTSSVFDIITFLVMFFVICPQVVGGAFHTLTSDRQILFIALFHAGWFVESLWTQTLVLHALRTPKIPFIQSRASVIMTLVTSLGILAGTVIPFTTFGAKLGLAPLPLNYFAWLFLIVAAYFTLVTIIKKAYIKHNREFL
jgi:Mg2+-importing ATPase